MKNIPILDGHFPTNILENQPLFGLIYGNCSIFGVLVSLCFGWCLCLWLGCSMPMIRSGLMSMLGLNLYPVQKLIVKQTHQLNSKLYELTKQTINK